MASMISSESRMPKVTPSSNERISIGRDVPGVMPIPTGAS